MLVNPLLSISLCQSFLLPLSCSHSPLLQRPPRTNFLTSLARFWRRGATSASNSIDCIPIPTSNSLQSAWPIFKIRVPRLIRNTMFHQNPWPSLGTFLLRCLAAVRHPSSLPALKCKGTREKVSSFQPTNSHTLSVCSFTWCGCLVSFPPTFCCICLFLSAASVVLVYFLSPLSILPYLNDLT